MLKLSPFLSTAFVTMLFAAIGAAHAQTPSAGAPRQVNVTADSTPGWYPSQEQEAAAAQAARAYLAAEDSGKTDEAYALLAKINQNHQPKASFADNVARFNAQAGAVIERRIVLVTWTKDSPNAPVPGVYAAIDLASRFEKIDRHCGYLILYQSPSGGPFRVMREEGNYLDNAAAKQMTAAEREATWARMSANCPNYMSKETKTPLPEQSESTIGYPTVAAALDALRKRSDVQFSQRDGWTVAVNSASTAVWSFTPPGHPAYPAAVKRQAVPEGDGSALKMSVQCEAAKAACDELVRSFQKMDSQMLQGLAHGR